MVATMTTSGDGDMERSQRARRQGVRISVSRDIATPLVNQIHNQVVAAIASGDLHTGDRLPTIRELAQFLRINRNTVSQAYQLLESTGHVLTRAGGGTTVAADSEATEPTRQHELRRLVTSALREATAHGFSAHEFGQLAYYEGQRWGCLPRVTVLVVHDYAGEMEVLCQAMTEESSAVDAQGMLLDKLADLADGERLGSLGQIDFALVPVRVLERTTELLAGAPFPVLGVGIGPSLATLVQVAKQTAGQTRRVAVVCSDPAGAIGMEAELRSAGVILGDVRRVATHEPALRDTVAWADLLLVCDSAVDAVAGLDSGKQVIHFATLVNDSSLATVRSYIEHVIQVKCRANTSR